jgi:hypothetical protein
MDRREFHRAFSNRLLSLSLLAVPFSTGWDAPQPALAAEAFAVEYRLTRWKSVHLHDEDGAKKLREALKMLGCEMKEEAHGDHMDLSFRCPQWRRLTVESAERRRTWEKWLKARGFETVVEN